MDGGAARLEAVGDPEATLEFRGETIIIPRAIEDWPLDMIRAAAAEPLPGRATVFAIKALLGAQSVEARVLDDVVELSHRMADAVGCSPLPETPVRPGDVFGGVPTLLDLIDNNPDDVASDLRRFWGVVYADRWRGTLTLREIWSYIRRLPATSATARARNGGDEVWQLQHFVTAAVYETLARQMYPGRPATQAEVERWIEATRKEAETVANLRAGAQRYAPTTPALEARDNAVMNRRKELARNAETTPDLNTFGN